MDAVEVRCETAAEKATAALASPTLPDYHAMLASIALIIAQGALGRIADITIDFVAKAFDRAITSSQAAHMRFWYGAVYARACRLNGRIDECARSAQQLSESARDVPGLAYANLAFLLGHAELVRGEIPTAIMHLHEALAGAEKHSVTTGLRAASCFALAEAHAKLGHRDAASDAIAEARRCVPADYLFMQTGLAVASGWALAADGYLTDAISIVRTAGEDARKRNQPTHELACLQVAAQWGDMPDATRARELADELSLPSPMPLPGIRNRCWPTTGRVCSRHRPTTGRLAIVPLPPMSPPRQRWRSVATSRVSAVFTPQRWRSSWPPTAAGCARRRCEIP